MEKSLRWLSRLSWFLGRSGDAETYAREALAVLEPEGPGLQLAWACSNYAQLHMLSGRVEGAVLWGERAIAAAEALGDREVLAHALNNVGTARGRVEEGDEAPALVERSLALALELGAEEHVARAYTNLGAGAVDARRLEAARRHLEAGLEYSAEHDLDSWRFYMMGWLAVCAFWEGLWDEAARVASDMLKYPRLAVPSRIQPLLVLGRVRARRGDPEAADALDEALFLASQTGELQRIGPVRAGRAEAALLEGRTEGVDLETEAAYRLAQERGSGYEIGELAWLRRQAGIEEAVPDGAATPYALMFAEDWPRAAEAWTEFGCPYETAVALGRSAEDDDLRRALADLQRLRRQADGRPGLAAPARARRPRRPARPSAVDAPEPGRAHRPRARSSGSSPRG